jgi:integrase
MAHIEKRSYTTKDGKQTLHWRARYRFAQAVTDGVIGRSPCIGIRLPEDRQREEMHFFTPEQVTVLAKTINQRFSTLIYTAAYTGMRAGELVPLRVPSLNLLAGTVSPNP